MSREKNKVRKERTINRKMNIRKRKDEHINLSISIYTNHCKGAKKKNKYLPQQKSNEITKNEKQERHITQSYIFKNKKCIFYVLIDVFLLFYSSIISFIQFHS
jgi:hypothetical protein